MGILVAEAHPIIASTIYQQGRQYFSDRVPVTCRVTFNSAVLFDAVATRNDVDILISDLEMAGPENVSHLLRAVKRVRPGLRVVLFSGQRHPNFVADVMASGADAFVSKSSYTDVLWEAVEAVQSGRKFVDQTVQGQSAEKHPWFISLSDAEREVITLLVQGVTMEEIAETRFRTYSTVAKQKRSALVKLGVHDEIHIRGYLRNNGLHHLLVREADREPVPHVEEKEKLAWDLLDESEKELLISVARGVSLDDVAVRRGLSRSTIKKRKNAAKNKLGFTDDSQITTYLHANDLSHLLLEQ